MIVFFCLVLFVCVIIGFCAYLAVIYTNNKHKYGNYSHWDIHVLARKLDPEAWARFDTAPDVMPEDSPFAGRPKSYNFFPSLEPSFNTAVKVLIAGYRDNKPRLHSDAELQARLRKRDNHW